MGKQEPCENKEAAKDSGEALRQKDKKIWVLAVAAAVLILAVTTVWFVSGEKAEEPQPPAIPQLVLTETPGLSEPEEVVLQEIDFEKLQAENADIIGWLRVPGTVIDYPVLCGLDNAFYLTHDEFKRPYAGGAVFIDMMNSNDFLDPVTVAYAHYMPDDTLFTQLHEFKDKDFFAQNREVIIFTPETKRVYEITAALTFGTQNILYQKDYTKEEDMQEFIDWLNAPQDENANLNTGGITKEDTFFIMSTCLSLTDSSGRYIVIAKLVEELPVQ